MSRDEGIVYLVGAGPGDPGLITQRGDELVREADVIVYDRLVSPRLLARARADVELVYAGKEPGRPGIGQEEINALLIDRARAGSRVVRLKGGDPFVFGRGGEEAQALRDAGIAFAVVPGVTAGVAAPAFAGIPVTHRDEASAVAFVTAHEDPAKDESALDWEALARFPGTLVFYMGVRSLESVAARLIEHGRSSEEPVAVVERGTTRAQRSVTAPLDEIAARVRDERIAPPAVTVVGPVAALSERLSWFELAPLHGKKVAVTRARPQASVLASRLEALGAEVVEAPAIRVESRVDAPEVAQTVRALAAGEFDVVCLTSANGASLLLEAAANAGLDARAFAGVTLAAIGPGTARSLAAHGLRADIVPPRSIAESLAAQLLRLGVSGRRVLIARAAEARDVLPRELERAGARVQVLALYDTVRAALDHQEREAIAACDYVTFTSASTVRFFCESLGGVERLDPRTRIVSIGPVTSEAARELGLHVHVEAQRHDIDGLVEALLADAGVALATSS